MDVTVVIGTYGDDRWKRLAARAAASVPPGVTIIHEHARTLHDARNQGLHKVTTEFVCHLDADDELTPDYFAHMSASTADVRAPSVQYVRGTRRHAPTIPRVWSHDHQCTAQCLPEGNWIVVGAVARTSLLRDIGGWRDFTWSEDWDVWLRCHLIGATFDAVPAAVYVAHVRPDSRNRAPTRAAKLAAHQEIYRANFPDAEAA